MSKKKRTMRRLKMINHNLRNNHLSLKIRHLILAKLRAMSLRLTSSMQMMVAMKKEKNGQNQLMKKLMMISSMTRSWMMKLEMKSVNHQLKI